MLNKNVCPNCGQLYDPELAKCPLCGTAPQVVETADPVQRKRITETERKQRRAERKEAEQEAKRRRKDARFIQDADEERLIEEEEARRKAEEEARTKAEEEARRLTEAEKPIFAPEEPAKTEASVMPPMMETIEGNVNDTLFETDSPSKSADKEARTAEGSSLFSYLNTSVEEKPSVRTLADTLNPQRANVEERLERKVNAKKVDDLRTIININDKFSFMSELFHNNMKAYNDFILRLNAYVDRQQALDYVADIAKQYSWNNESLAVKNFYKVFDRKF